MAQGVRRRHQRPYVPPAGLTEAEKERRLAVSAALRASPGQKAHHDRLRGKKKGPEPMETLAKKHASKKAVKGTKAWTLAYKHHLQLQRLKAKQDEERRQALAR